LTGYAWHIGWFATFLFFGAHLPLFKSILGFVWPALPNSVVLVLAAMTLGILFTLWIRRFYNPVLRLISNFDDHLSVFLAIAPLITGIAAFGHWSPFGMQYEGILAIHILSVELLMVWMPFGKIFHVITSLIVRFPHRAQPSAAGECAHELDQRIHCGRRVREAGQRTSSHGTSSLSPEEQVARAKEVILSNLDSRTAMELETCIHCGMCSEACHFYEATHEAKYTPIHKVHLVRSVYRRELSPMRWFNRLFTREITAQDLSDWQELCSTPARSAGDATSCARWAYRSRAVFASGVRRWPPRTSCHRNCAH
jgi:ferredoxin